MKAEWKKPTLALFLIIVASFIVLQNVQNKESLEIVTGEMVKITGLATVSVGDKFVVGSKTYTITTIEDDGNIWVFDGKNNQWAVPYTDISDIMKGYELRNGLTLNLESDYVLKTSGGTPTIPSTSDPVIIQNTNTDYSDYRKAFIEYLDNKGYSIDQIADTLNDEDKIKQIQTELGVTPDGIIGPKTGEAANNAMGESDSTTSDSEEEEKEMREINEPTPNADNSVTIPIPLPSGIPLRVTSSYDENSRTAELKINGKDMTYTVDDGFKIGKDDYKLGKCGGEPCFRGPSEDKDIILTEEQYKDLKNIKKYIGKEMDKACIDNNGKRCPDTQNKDREYMKHLTNIADSALTQVLTAYLDEWLGEFTNKWPYEIFCDDKIRKGDTDTNMIKGIPVPDTEWESELEEDIYNNMRTVVIFGNVEAITDKLYRYDVTVKLVGDMESPAWELYLYNSCSGNNSKELWMEEGSISFKQVFQMLYAGQREEDMIFECGVDPLCKFDYVYLKFDDEATTRKFKLAGADLITDICN